jgi:hypothetical protein
MVMVPRAFQSLLACRLPAEVCLHAGLRSDRSVVLLASMNRGACP